MWVDIPGYRWPYRINDEGTVEKQLPNGTWVKLNPYLAGRSRVCVKMRTAENKQVDMPVVWLMADAFMKGRIPGMCIVHKNGSKFDCSLRNLQYMTYVQCGKLSGSNRRRPVLKLDKSGEVVAIYKSVTEAANKNYLSRTAVWHRCAGKVKNPYDLDGYDYKYER